MSDQMKELKVVLPQVEALRKLPSLVPSKDVARLLLEDAAMDNTALLLGSFRKTDADAPEVFSRALEHVRARYEVDIQRAVTEPGRWKFPPTAFELREACESIANARARGREREQRVAAQLEERRLLDTEQAERKPLLKYKSRDNPGHVPRAAQERRQAERVLARYEAEAKASARPPPAPSVFELNPQAGMINHVHANPHDALRRSLGDRRNSRRRPRPGGRGLSHQ